MKKHFVVMMCVLFAGNVAFAQDTKIRFFGQPEVGSNFTKETNRFMGVSPQSKYLVKDSTYSKTNANTGSFALFVTSQLSDRVSVLSEVSFSNSGKTSSFELQRLMVRYNFQDYFSVRAGKMFTPIGYWNNQYTLGLVLQPTISRPAALRTVADGGVLQYKDNGVQIEGDNITAARLSYKFMLANGIGYFGSNEKNDHHVAATAQIGIEPVEGLKIMGSGMFDRIEKDKPNPNGTIAKLPDNGTMHFYVASVAYMNPEKRAEFIAEYLTQTSKFETIGTKSSYSYYVYGGYKVTDKITPYILYNHTRAGKSSTEPDPYFSPLPVSIDVVVIGARYKFSSSFIAKVEYESNARELFYQDITAGTVKLDNGFANGIKANSLKLQLAFVF